MASQHQADYDVIAVGAGFSGLGLIHHMREAGLSIQVFDKASDIGGTWAWNHYPGAASDSECYYYCLTFSKEILQEWKWSVRYPGWEENLRYMHFVADKCDMWPHIQLNTEIVSADFQEASGLWLVKTGAGDEYTCKYFVSAMGMISEPVTPKFKGMEKFKGACFHSARWPEGLDYAGKRVGIIGSGATTVQMLPVTAETAESVTVFQRTANFIMPAVQKPMTPEWEKEIKENYDDIIAKCRNHVFGMAFDSPVGRTIADTPPEEVQKILEEHWPRGSFRFVFETFDDLLGDPESNRIVGDFVINKMKERVKDPEIAEMLTPKGYPFFAKRPPLDHNYFEAYNRDNVKLVDINDREPIVEFTETGIRTTENEYEFDIIVLATGFQAYTGGQEALPIRGRNGLLLRDKWDAVSSSILGVFVAEFPNLFMITGPQAPFANLPTSIEQNIMYIVDCLKKMESEGYDLCEPQQKAEDDWVQHVAEIHEQTLMAQGDKVHSWMMGANLEDRAPRVLIYFGGANVYYDLMRSSVDSGFPEVQFEKLAS
ncbi:MAG: NAD(P)/FAD-dependent oxidoreductase [Gammaproteobacteria bacterium]|nr:NAD(P)/FAD-dependent oxidoreductase [Gammaproteobacteria bacterium]MBT3868842.1 NAD(P)/FAD-dependent oxidoreductase [Gammaproteobacteria bacterium]MBT4379206.1 NAD(P)/FAD-dependent oxidoreductase [Gammaproteobacteria bacterium]MBT4616792.1 NAD(P)/FAD-dependent oxidoreductase [Gammaproteobacteria bacterium]MBT5195915.1 NAD(P)/FAD-dependent oxidoreductase [Gammaproteobacteria bacterium]